MPQVGYLQRLYRNALSTENKILLDVLTKFPNRQLTEDSLNLTEVSLTLTEVSPCFLLSCKANARVKLVKTWHGPHSSNLVVICVVRLLFVSLCVMFLCKCVLYYCHRVSTRLHLTNISTSTIIIKTN